MKHSEWSNGLDTALYKNIPFFYFSRARQLSMMGKSSSMSLEGFNHQHPLGGHAGGRACSDVIRSRSFTSMTNYQRSSSSGPASPVLGEMFRNPSGSQRSLNGIGGPNLKKLPKLPAVPRPHRIAVIFDSVKMGLRSVGALHMSLIIILIIISARKIIAGLLSC